MRRQCAVVAVCGDIEADDLHTKLDTEFENKQKREI